MVTERLEGDPHRKKNSISFCLTGIPFFFFDVFFIISLIYFGSVRLKETSVLETKHWKELDQNPILVSEDLDLLVARVKGDKSLVSEFRVSQPCLGYPVELTLCSSKGRKMENLMDKVSIRKRFFSKRRLICDEERYLESPFVLF